MTNHNIPKPKLQRRIDQLTREKRELQRKIEVYFEQKDPLQVPEREISEVLEFFGLEMDEGRLTIETFDQIANGLIKACNGHFQDELVKAKERWKLILVLRNSEKDCRKSVR